MKIEKIVKGIICEYSYFYFDDIENNPKNYELTKCLYYEYQSKKNIYKYLEILIFFTIKIL